MSEEARELVIRLMIMCAAVSWLVILWRMNNNEGMPNFSFRNLFATRDGGYPDRVAIMEIGSWVGMTGALLVLTLRNSLTEWFCAIYTGVFVLRGAHSAYLHATKPPFQGTVTTKQESSSQTRTVGDGQ